MKKPSHLSWFLVMLVSLALVFPPATPGQTQSAGVISREIPNVSLEHRGKSQLAAPNDKVMWGDEIATDRGGRARIALDDGSILNVGSDSRLRVVQHDAANQRTQLQLAYGRLRTSAVRLARPGSSFEVRSPTAVAGVVGTGFDFSYINGITSLSVNEGSVNFCNLRGECVPVGAGFSSAIRGTDAPSQPVPTTPATAAENARTTALEGMKGAGVSAGTGVTATAAPAVSGPLVVGLVITGVVGGAIGVAAGAASQPKKCGCTTVP